MGQKKKISKIKFFTIPSEELTFWFSLFPSSFQDRYSFPGSVCACLGILLWWRDRCKPAHFQWLLFAGIPRFSPFTEFKINLGSHPSFKALCMISWGLYCNCDCISKSPLPNFASLTLYRYFFQEYFPDFNLKTPILLSLPNVCAD